MRGILRLCASTFDHDVVHVIMAETPHPVFEAALDAQGREIFVRRPQNKAKTGVF